MEILCIDWGNTRVKAALFNESGQIRKRWESESPNPENELEACFSFEPGGVILSAAAEVPPAFLEKLEGQPFFIQLNSQTRLPIINAYYSQQTLGPDRLAAAVALQHEHPGQNNLAICAGTCITYNFTTNRNTFRGGAISPGLQMRLDAMHHFTARLPEVSLRGELLLLGYDTETCMRSGALLGAAFEVEKMLEAYAAQYPDFNAVLTGGDAPLLARQLKNRIFADPDLILKGLYLILKHNVPSLP